MSLSEFLQSKIGHSLPEAASTPFPRPNKNKDNHVEEDDDESMARNSKISQDANHKQQEESDSKDSSENSGIY